MRAKLKWFCSVAVLATLTSPVRAEAPPPDKGNAKFELTKFRFSRKNKLGYERLVLEFSLKEKGVKRPSAKLTSNPTAKEASISVNSASLVGAIPEAMINDSYVPKSNYLGPISINTDELPGGFVVKLSLKSTVADMQAFWVQNPGRLVLDVFPTKAAKMAALRSSARGLASEGSRANPHAILCFPSKARVLPSVVFQPKQLGSGPSLADGMDASGTQVEKDLDSIACYPAGTQLNAIVNFAPPYDDGPSAALQKKGEEAAVLNTVPVSDGAATAAALNNLNAASEPSAPPPAAPAPEEAKPAPEEPKPEAVVSDAPISEVPVK